MFIQVISFIPEAYSYGAIVYWTLSIVNVVETIIHHCSILINHGFYNKNVEIKCSAHDAFRE